MTTQFHNSIAEKTSTTAQSQPQTDDSTSNGNLKRTNNIRGMMNNKNIDSLHPNNIIGHAFFLLVVSTRETTEISSQTDETAFKGNSQRLAF